jgi:PAS domain S-box-containing protein
MVALRTGREVRNVVMGVYNPREERYRWITITAVPLLRPGEERPYQVYTIFDDITERKQREEELRRLNRTLAAHSHSDQALLRATTEAEFMQEVCRIIVEDCGHAMVWVGFAEDDEARSIRPVAYAGFEEGYLERLHLTWADTERGRGPTGTAIRTAKPSFCRDMLTDPQFAPWREEALSRGYASSLVLPLLESDRAFGALTIYFREPDPFAGDEIALLQGLADDLAYGIRMIRLRDAHVRAEQALRRAHDELELQVKERTEELLQTNEQLRAEIEEKNRTEQSLRLEEARLDALLRLSRMSGASLSEITGFVLEQGIALTQSKIGFVGFLNEDESIYTLNAVSKEVVKECDVAGDPVQWHVAEAGVWAEAIRQRRTLFINDYSKPHPLKKGFPSGHPYVEKFMVVPILEGERVAAVAGIGNKATDYDSSDERQIALLLDGMCRWAQLNAAREALQKAHDELQASEERFRQLAENIQQVFWMLEPATQRLLYVSPAYESIWGRSSEELYDRPLSLLDTIHADDRQQVAQGFSAGWGAYDGEFRIVRPDGALRWIRLRSFPVHNERGEVYRLAGVATDLTEQKAAEAAVIQAERLAVAGKMAASLVHEINNPLQSVIGCLGLAKAALEKSEDPSKYVRIAHQEVRRTAQIVGQLRSLGRPGQTGQKEPADLNSLVGDVLTLNKKQLQNRNIEVIWEPDADLAPVAVMPDALRQVFLNLVLNALDAMPEGGQLRVSTERTRSPAGIRVVVADSGTGIAPAVLPHLFEAFYSTKSQGIGLGLFVSQNLVQQHGGRIEVESQPGVGTRFSVWLPA